MSLIPHDLAETLSEDFPSQKAFTYPADRWRSWTGHLEGNAALLDALPAALDRATTARVVEEQLARTPRGVGPAFTVAMMWGHGFSGYGPYRTARILTGAISPLGCPLSGDVLARLSDSADIARRDGPVEGYRFLNTQPGRIGGLGPAFFTKWLYFATARGQIGSPTAAPILDALVVTWFREHADSPLRAGYTDDYARYVETLTAWGAPNGLAPAQVEERIFRLIRNDGG